MFGRKESLFTKGSILLFYWKLIYLFYCVSNSFFFIFKNYFDPPSSFLFFSFPPPPFPQAPSLFPPPPPALFCIFKFFSLFGATTTTTTTWRQNFPSLDDENYAPPLLCLFPLNMFFFFNMVVIAYNCYPLCLCLFFFPFLPTSLFFDPLPHSFFFDPPSPSPLFFSDPPTFISLCFYRYFRSMLFSGSFILFFRLMYIFFFVYMNLFSRGVVVSPRTAQS